jgi:hypothetical protein
MATPTAARSSSPQFFIAFVAAEGISSDRGEPGLQGAATLRDAEPDGVGADCNTNRR